MNKTGIREFTYKNKGQVFSFLLQDDTGKIKITGFNALVNKNHKGHQGTFQGQYIILTSMMFLFQ